MHPLGEQISNRFNTSGVATEAIFSVDDDRKIPCELVTEAFLLWLHMGNLSMVLPVYDAARWIDLDVCSLASHSLTFLFGSPCFDAGLFYCPKRVNI